MTTLLIDTTDATFDSDVLRSTLPVLLEFWAPWCGPCKALAPILARIAIQHQGKLRIVKYDVDQNKDSMHRFKLRGVPTLIAYRAGEEIGRHAGGDASGLKLLLEALLAGPEPQMDPGTNTFGNDPDCKARCIARIEQAIAEGRLGGPSQKHDSDDLPSTIAMGQTSDSGGPDVLGLPPVIDALYNYFYEMLAADPGGRQFSADFLRSIPVGVDLSLVPRDYLLWILNEVMGQLPAESEAALLLADLVNLHRNDSLAGTVPLAQWEALQARIKEKGLATGKRDALILAAVAPLAMPAASIPATSFFLLIRAAVSLPVQQIASTWWTAEEAEVFDRTNRSMAPFMQALGPCPEEPEALAEYELKKHQFIDDAWAKAYSICPTLEKQRQSRLRAIEKAGNQERNSHARYLLKRLANS